MEYTYNNNFTLTAILEKDPVVRKGADEKTISRIELKLVVKPLTQKSFTMKMVVRDPSAFDKLLEFKENDIIETTGEFILDSYMYKDKYWIDGMLYPTVITRLGKYTGGNQPVVVNT